MRRRAAVALVVAWLPGLAIWFGLVPPSAPPPALAQEPGKAVQFTIDAGKDVKPISRFIYGTNRPLDGAYTHSPLTRLGGNRWTAYNWVTSASNAGNDWKYQNDNNLSRSNVPGAAVSPRLQNAFERKAGIILTIPMSGYVAADKKGDGDVRKSGPDYLKTRFLPGLPSKGRPFTLTPNPKDPVYQDEFVNWVTVKYPHGWTDPERPIFFCLDNEPDLWSSTHAEVHPKPASYAELIEKTIAYARAIKAVQPKALVFGPVNYGWQGFVRLQNAPDAKGRDFQEVYLKALAQAEKTHGKRLLDVLDVHWYPEARGGKVRITGGTSPEVVAARLQAPRSLWDPSYRENSWIANDVLRGPIKLLPRLWDKIARNYPGTKLAITEYNYGGGNHISGAIAQADVLGIFGREGVFAACHWPLSGKEPYIGAAFQMYRDFDGKGGAFGATAIQARTDDASTSSVYASLDSAKSPKFLTVVGINKTEQPLRAGLRLVNLRPRGEGQVYQLTAAGAEPRPAGKLAVPDPGNVSYTMPPMSVSTIRLPVTAAARGPGR
jgi:hypothetical protein